MHIFMELVQFGFFLDLSHSASSWVLKMRKKRDGVAQEWIAF
jgi:hypothetical protein